VIAKRHAQELHHLTSHERSGFWGDVAMVEGAIASLFNPVKFANLSMGFRMPHYHCHVYPQYSDDDPFRLLDPQHGDVRLEDDDWRARLHAVRAACTT
jgi:diadenosine tetraphosphate (Ap4A) HIT family hydrolase